jgi:tRNA (guanine-N7-)-methyltransferase
LSKNKQQKFKENSESGIVVEPGTPLFGNIRGCWNKDFFKNENPITVEIACGRGEYTTGLAAIFPKRNFIGVDIKGARIWKGMKLAVETQLRNVGFLRCQIDHMDLFFAPGEISEMWITFPDPRPKKGDAKRRLTSPRFLKIYSDILKPGSTVHLKTDNTGLFDYSLDAINSFDGVTELQWAHDLYQSAWAEDHHGITTRYERMFAEAGETIKYLRFKMP